MKEGLSASDKVRKLLHRHRIRDAVLALGYAVKDADDLLSLTVNHNAPASAGAHATFFVAKSEQTFPCLTAKAAVPVNQPAFRV